MRHDAVALHGRLIEIGLFAADGEEREIELCADLLDQGLSADEIVAGVRSHGLPAVVAERRLRGSHEAITLDEAARSAGVDPGLAHRIFRAVGYPDPAAMPLRPDDVHSLRFFGSLVDAFLTEDQVVHLGRLFGRAMAQIAEAEVAAVRIGVEGPARGEGASETEVAELMGALVDELVPQVALLMDSLHRGHLLEAIRRAWAPDPTWRATTMELSVLFVDLVGFTQRVGGLDHADLAGLLARFEQTLGTVVDRHHARVVKLIGDEAMVVVGSVDVAAQVALDLTETFHSDDTLPEVRVGFEHGAVVSQDGDYFGDPANLAARLVAVARPGTVVAGPAASTLLDGSGVVVRSIPATRLSGFPAPVRSSVVRRPRSVSASEERLS